MPRYCISVELYDWVHVEIEGPPDGNREDLLDLLEEHFMEHGYPQVFLDVSRKTALIVPKDSPEAARHGWPCDEAGGP